MEKDEIIAMLRNAILNCDIDEAKNAAKAALEANIDPVEAIENGLAPGIREVGERFERSEVFLPHLVLAADAMTEAAKILQSSISPGDMAKVKKGTVVMATVEGDLHDLGKNLVSVMLKAAGFEVYDLGRDVPTDTIISKALEVNADIIGLSSLMSTTRPYQRELIEELKRRGLRERFKVMVGGGTVYKQWAEEIGADGYGYNASEAVQKALELMSQKIPK
ncbi:MAG: corrinoid protein [Candidatus Bathyarchaeia archaeon]